MQVDFYIQQWCRGDGSVDLTRDIYFAGINVCSTCYVSELQVLSD